MMNSFFNAKKVLYMKKQFGAPADLLVAQKYVYEPMGLYVTNLHQDKESQEYGACSFDLNAKQVIFRVAKITPTKNGQFVTLWKRIADGPIVPLDINDRGDILIISVRRGNDMGQFVFPKNVLARHNVISQNNNGGKRALRVYPPWDSTQSMQAKKTQAWQLMYFFSITLDKPLDSGRIKHLLL